MALKVFVASLLVAFVYAGGPASYSISAPSHDYYSVGSSNEHTVKGLYGQNVLSSYTKSVATPHSHAHVSLSKSSNDIGLGYKAPLGYPGYAAPLISGYYGGFPGYHAPLSVAKPFYPYGSPGFYPAHKSVAPVPVLGNTVSFHGLGAHYGW
ncbi:uncharacterized protein LOC134835347 [Culicoides brevitarsis]|uniref:uncharacterized protein LOC134835347 n=1 Tax=Culicoides brevitarsis TaxID=469753 RepID=UPI00307C9032